MTRPQRSSAQAVTDLSRVQCVGYLRVSTTQQATEDRTSLADQRAAIEAAASRRGLTVGAWFTDAGVSGAAVEKRDGFSALVQSCERHPRTDPGFVLALNDSRWGRFEDPEEGTYWRQHLKRFGWLVFFAEGDDTTDEMARGVLRFVGQAEASKYRKQLQANTRRGMKGTADSGYWSRREPYGYRRAVVVGRPRVLEPGERKAEGERVALVPYEPEARVVRHLFEAYGSGKESLRSLYAWAVEHAPERLWSIRAIQIVLTNRTYCGDVVSGRRCSDATGYGKEDAHPAVVSRELFGRVGARLAENRQHPRSPRSPWLLSALVTCPHCGEPYVAGGFGGRAKGGKRIQFYADRGGRVDLRHGKRCSGPTGTVSRHLLEGAVIDTVGAVLASPAVARRLEQAIDRYLDRSTTTSTAARADAKKELARLEKRRENLVAALADGTITRDEAAPQMAAIRAQIERAATEAQRAAFTSRQAEASVSERQALLELASDFAARARSLPPMEVRELLRPWLHSATFDKQSRELTLTIRRIPAASPLILGGQPGRGSP
jgi:DNA invertase Pin-like site-specific DNA recombinase